jgi:RNA polymerase sigma-70 factor (ECF subfamily)
MGLTAKHGTVQRLVEDHYDMLYRYAFRLTGTAADAEDLTQEAFCKAHLKYDQLRDSSCLKAWLFRIMRNCYLQSARAAKPRRFVSLEEVGDVAEPLPGPLPAIDPERLQRTLNELPEMFRTPIILFYFEDFSYRDIAEHMDLPIGTVMSRIARAKAHLRARLLAPAPEAVLAHASQGASHGL